MKNWLTTILEGLSLVKWIGSALSGILRIDRNKNKKIEREEVFLLVREILNVELFTIVPSMSESLKQILKANEEERAQLVEKFSEEFDLDNDETETAIEEILASANVLVSNITRLIKKRDLKVMSDL